LEHLRATQEKEGPLWGKRAWGKEETWEMGSVYLFFFAFFFGAIGLFSSRTGRLDFARPPTY
jgi:hypothetical protein